MVKTIFAEAGLSGNKNNHSFRVAGASSLFAASVPERVIKERLAMCLLKDWESKQVSMKTKSLPCPKSWQERKTHLKWLTLAWYLLLLKFRRNCLLLCWHHLVLSIITAPSTASTLLHQIMVLFQDLLIFNHLYHHLQCWPILGLLFFNQLYHHLQYQPSLVLLSLSYLYQTCQMYQLILSTNSGIVYLDCLASRWLWLFM